MMGLIRDLERDLHRAEDRMADLERRIQRVENLLERVSSEGET